MESRSRKLEGVRSVSHVLPPSPDLQGFSVKSLISYKEAAFCPYALVTPPGVPFFCDGSLLVLIPKK